MRLITSAPFAVTLAVLLTPTDYRIQAFPQSVKQQTEEPAQETTGLGAPVVHEVAPGVLAVTGLYHAAGEIGVSAGIIVTKDHVVFIDAGMTTKSGEYLLKEANRHGASGKLALLVLTHHHSDHVFGMNLFKENGATVIAHTATQRFLANDDGYYKNFIIRVCGWGNEKGDDILGPVKLSVPDIFIDADTVLLPGWDEIHVLVTPGHVPGELAVYHPRSQTLFAGDAVYEGMPPHTKFGGPAEWQEWVVQLERLKDLNAEIIVPGHGHLCGVHEIDRNISYLKEMIGDKD